MRRFFSISVACVLIGSQTLGQPIMGTWQFDGNYDNEFTGRLPIIPFGVIDFENAIIGGQSAQVASFVGGGFFRVPNEIGANGGGLLTNQYTILMDVLFTSTGGGFISLLQTNPANNDDADWFINPDNGLGVAGDYFDPLSRFSNGEWQRVVIVIDTTSPSGSTENTVYRVYINGQLHNIVQQPSEWGRDGRFALYPDILIFADEDNETSQGWINNLQIRNYAMSADEVAELGTPSAGALPVASGVTGSWTFDNTFDAQVGATAMPVGSGNFETDLINGDTALVYRFEQNSFLRITHGISPNGGGSLVNQYTVIMDIKFPANRTGFTSLLQTNPLNGDDGDCFINGANGIGISGDYTEPSGVRFQAGEWQRVALVIDTSSTLGNATYTSYINGVRQNQVQFPTDWGIDGRFALRNEFLMFADDDGEVASGYINSLQLRAYAMTEAEIAALGGPTANGLPVPPVGDVNLDGCVDDADLLAVLFAFGGSGLFEDLNGDDTVDDADLLLVLFNFGVGC